VTVATATMNRPVMRHRETRGDRLKSSWCRVQTKELSYEGPAAWLEDVFGLHWQVEPHPVKFEIGKGGTFRYEGDARNMARARGFYEAYQDSEATRRVTPFGRRLLRGIQEAVSLFRELF
jgi:hypothetical protein